MLPVIINLLIIFLIVYIGIQSRKKTSPVNESTSQPAPDSEQVKQKNTKREALARQKALEDKYFNSPLTREIIHLHRGTIRAYNGDTGAVFEISFPVSR